MTKSMRTIIMLILTMLGMTQVTMAADFRDFSVIVNNQSGTLLTTNELSQGTSVSFGVAVDAEGTVSRVAADDASAVATVSGNVISWENDPQVRCTVIFKDGRYVGNTADNQFTVSETGTYSLRTANEMGGLSTEETTVEVISTGIDTLHPSPSTFYPSSSTTYNLAGQRVGSSYKGIVVVNGKKVVKK